MHDGYKSQDKFQTVLEQFSRPRSKFAPFVFWFYDQDLTTVGIKPQEMARELAKKGFNPGYAHARPNYAWVDGHRDSEHVQGQLVPSRFPRYVCSFVGVSAPAPLGRPPLLPAVHRRGGERLRI